MESNHVTDRVAVIDEAEQAKALEVISSELAGAIQGAANAELTSGVVIMNVPVISDKLHLLVTMKLNYSTTKLYETLVANAIAEILAELPVA